MAKIGEASAQTVPDEAVARAERREAPAPEPIHHGEFADPSHPWVPDEPVLAIDDIQGNILGGFNKDHQTLIALKIDDAIDFKAWLTAQIPFVATSAEVIAFNRLFKALRRRHGEPTGVKATWFNIAFSYDGLQELGVIDPADDFDDAAFTDGLAARSEGLGDFNPADPSVGHPPSGWVVGGTDPAKAAHVLLIVASDDEADMEKEVVRLLADVVAGTAGAHEVWREAGSNLPKDHPKMGDLRGHEHFGFLDGVSQPGLRGRLSDVPRDVLTTRQNPNDRDQGKPGQDLLWPGEFVVGYPGQDELEEGEAVTVADPGPLSAVGPDWARNGSFLVFRRLRQDVAGLHAFLRDQATALAVPDPADPNAGPASLVGSRLVGRWRTGAPVMRAPADDNPELAADDCANNNFEFQEAIGPIPLAADPSPFDCVDDEFVEEFEGEDVAAPSDKNGERCPFTGHIRKVYPRDDESATVESLNEVNTQTHRILRRGIPFGPTLDSSPEAPAPDDGVERGLHFLAYQTSIEEQFEFIVATWANNRDFKENATGIDPIIGQNNEPGENRKRTFQVPFVDASGTQKDEPVETFVDWVIPTGGEYFFAPSLDALENVLAV